MKAPPRIAPRPSLPQHPSLLRGLREPAAVLPGLAAALAVAVTASGVARVSPLLSAVAVAIVVGILVRNVTGLATSLQPGIAVAARTLLRVGVALLGLQLVPGDVLALGWTTLAGVVVIVGGGIPLLLLLGRALGVPPARRLLVACGFSICGAAAVAAVETVTDNEEEDATAAIAMVVAFGTAAMLVLPAAASLLGMGQVTAGTWAGGSVHEVGQVVAAGGMLGTIALEVAVLVKLGRVVMLAPVIALLSARRRAGLPQGTGRPALLPGFVVVFIALMAARGITDLPAGLVDGVGWVQSLTLTAAMFALGCGVDVRSLRRRLGRGEVLLGALGSVVVSLLALGIAVLAG